MTSASSRRVISPSKRTTLSSCGTMLRVWMWLRLGKCPPMVKWQLHAGFAEHADDALVLENVELEDEREADDDRVGLDGSGDDLIERSLDVTDDDGVTVLAEGGREVSQAKVALMLEADQKDGPGGVAHYGGCLRVKDRELRDINHHDSLQCAREDSDAGPHRGMKQHTLMNCASQAHM